MASLEKRLESLMSDESDDDDDDVVFAPAMRDDQLLHLAKNSPELLTKSQLLKLIQLNRPVAQSSDGSETQSDAC